MTRLEGIQDAGPAPDTGGGVTAAAALVERLAQGVARHVTVRNVFGEPVEAQGATVVPVARVAFGFGGGGGAGQGPSAADVATPGGGGGAGGGGGRVTPAGYLVLRDGQVRYRPIVDLQGLAALVLAAAALVRVLRGGGPRSRRVEVRGGTGTP